MIRLHIEELVLHGFDPRDRHSIADAVRSELARTIGKGDLPDGSREAIDAGEVTLDSVRSKEAGASIAGAIRGGMAR